MKKTLSTSLKIIAIAALTFGQPSLANSAEEPNLQKMWQTIQQQQQIITDLEARLSDAEQRLTTNDSKVEAATDAIEATADAIEEQSMLATNPGLVSATTVGGYGELHYNNNQDADDEIDFHRFVLYFAHQFADNIRFFSELELEHALAGDGKNGEIELEQAWIEMDITNHHRLRVGVDIVPVGLVNYTHEPNRFYGVERPEVEKRIIPGTWWEAGIGLNGELAAGWNYDAVLHSGLNTTSNIRSGRQKVSEANADHPAFTTRLRYTGTPGLEIGTTTHYQSDITAGEAGRKSNSAYLLESHIDWKHHSGIALRALYARWHLDDQLSISGDARQSGYYIEPAYRFALSSMPGEVGIFTRWSDLDYGDSKKEARAGIGLNYWPTDKVAFKFDWINIEDRDADDSKVTWNLGLAYEF